MKNERKKSIEWLLIGILLLVLAATMCINMHIARHVLDDDASSELMLADLLHREKSLYSEDFYYSTEFSLPNQLIFGFLFNFFDGWANVRFVGTCFIQLLYLASFLYMMSQSGLSRKMVLFSAILIMLPFTVSYGRTILYHCYYEFNYISTFLIAGILFSVFRKPNASRTGQIIRLTAGVAISFFTCSLYILQIFLVLIPITGCLFFFLLARSEGEKTPYRKWMLIPIAFLVASIAGLFFNSYILIPRLNLYEQNVQHLQVLSTAYWGPILAALLIQFGFRTGVELFSLTGILSLGGIFNAVILMYASVRDLLTERNGDFREFMMRTMLPVTLLVNLVVFIFGDIPFRLQVDYSRYLVPASVWIIPLLCTQLSTKEKLPHIRKLIYLICTAVFIANGIRNGISFMDSQNFGQPYDGISYDNPHLVDDLQTAVEYIRVHDYSYGYAFAGEANTMVEIMNGTPIASLRRRPDAELEYTNWLTLESHKHIPAERAFFLMTDRDESFYEKALSETGAEKVYFDDLGYVIYDISDLGLFRDHIREPLK